MKMAMKLLVLGVCSAILSGCVAPVQPQRSIQWINPEPDGYYTGERPDFANRFNPDPQGRKFRVAYLCIRLESIEGKVGGEAIETAAENAMSLFYGTYMRFREQATRFREQTMASRQGQNDQKLEDAFRASVKSGFSYERSNIKYHLAAANLVAAGGWDANGGVLGEPTPHEFARHCEDMEFLNAELASRYPDLFTTDESGFPLDIAMIGLYTQGYPFVRTRFEAWCIGLPEHANVGWNYAFQASEVFLDPYDSIADAVFQLTDEQFEGLEPANPKDHDWLEEK